MKLRLARTPAEAYLFMARQPCPGCGVTGFVSDRSASEVVDGVLARRYRGACPGCGRARDFVFRVPDDPGAPVGLRPGFGDEVPSELLDPGEWLELADAMLAQVPNRPGELGDAERREAGEVLAAGVEALREVLRFARPGEARLWPFAFWTERGRRLRFEAPARFDVDRLLGQLAEAEAMLELYRH